MAIPRTGFYDGPVPGVRLSPASNDCLYTIFPVDGASHLGWSENRQKREHAVNLMLASGINVVNMSYWGPHYTDRWAFWAPMQTAAGAHDELFDAAVGRPVLIAPYIESGAATVGHTQIGCHGDVGPVGESIGYNFLDTFPGTHDDPAPQLVEQIVDLIERYLLKPANPAWRGKWAQMYDRNGKPRYVVSLIHVGSNQPGVSDETFAKGLLAREQRANGHSMVRRCRSRGRFRRHAGRCPDRRRCQTCPQACRLVRRGLGASRPQVRGCDGRRWHCSLPRRRLEAATQTDCPHGLCR